MAAPFDIVVLVGPKDKMIIHRQMEFTRRNVVGYRKIFVVASDPALKVEGCEMVPESVFPFSKEDVAFYTVKSLRNGWYLQQLLKFYAGLFIPGILDRYLTIDCDTYFLKPTTFVSPEGKSLYSYSVENYPSYFTHMQKLHEDFVKVGTLSGICHHMMFEKRFVEEIMALVEKKHGMTFWQAFLVCIDEEDYLYSGSSEYEIYFNYIFRFHTHEVELRWLEYSHNYMDPHHQPERFDYVSQHWWGSAETIRATAAFE